MLSSLLTSQEIKAALDELICANDKVSYYEGREVVVFRDVNEQEKNRQR